MTDDEIRAAAWKILVDGAESMAEDWIDECDDYPGNARVIFTTQMRMVEALRKLRSPDVEVNRDDD